MCEQRLYSMSNVDGIDAKRAQTDVMQPLNKVKVHLITLSQVSYCGVTHHFRWREGGESSDFRCIQL